MLRGGGEASQTLQRGFDRECDVVIRHGLGRGALMAYQSFIMGCFPPIIFPSLDILKDERNIMNELNSNKNES